MRNIIPGAADGKNEIFFAATQHSWWDRFIVNWAFSIYTLFFITMLSVTFTIKYPERITLVAKVIRAGPEANVLRLTGRISEEHEQIESGMLVSVTIRTKKGDNWSDRIGVLSLFEVNSDSSFNAHVHFKNKISNREWNRFESESEAVVSLSIEKSLMNDLLKNKIK